MFSFLHGYSLRMCGGIGNEEIVSFLPRSPPPAREGLAAAFQTRTYSAEWIVGFCQLASPHSCSCGFSFNEKVSYASALRTWRYSQAASQPAPVASRAVNVWVGNSILVFDWLLSSLISAIWEILFFCSLRSAAATSSVCAGGGLFSWLTVNQIQTCLVVGFHSSGVF